MEGIFLFLAILLAGFVAITVVLVFLAWLITRPRGFWF